MSYQFYKQIFNKTKSKTIWVWKQTNKQKKHAQRPTHRRVTVPHTATLWIPLYIISQSHVLCVYATAIFPVNNPLRDKTKKYIN